jgi:16S rRNA (cytidine1402-2'-O)-methyltransferase
MKKPHPDPAELAGGRSALATAVVAELERRVAEPVAPGLHLVATPIGNLGDVTLRALAVLARADHVYCEDTRHSRTLLAHFAIDRSLRPYHEHNAEAERPRVLALLAQGRSVALVSDAGTPLVSDPGYKLVKEAAAAGHLVTALPGPSAVLAALAVGGLPMDHFHFAGFLPPRESARRTRLAELAAIPATLVLFEAPNRLAALLEDIVHTLGADRPVVVAREMTKRFEEVRRGAAGELALWATGDAPRGEVVVLVGAGVPAEATDADIAAALDALVGEAGLKEASRQIAARLGVPRSRVYQIGLDTKARE